MSKDLDGIHWGLVMDGQHLPKTLDELITNWISYNSSEDKDADGRWWTYEAARVLTDRYPDLALAFIYEAAVRPMPEVVRAYLGAGPLEELLANHGTTMIDKIEKLAKSEPLFRETLANVWQNEMTPEMWARAQAAMVA